MEHGQHTRSCILYPLATSSRSVSFRGYMLYFYLSWDSYYAYLGCLPLGKCSDGTHTYLGTVEEGHNRKVREGRPRLLLAPPLLLALMMALWRPSIHSSRPCRTSRGVVLSRHGGCVGARACVHGKALEFDLLNVAEGASIGRLCDTSATVETR